MAAQPGAGARAGKQLRGRRGGRREEQTLIHPFLDLGSPGGNIWALGEDSEQRDKRNCGDRGMSSISHDVGSNHFFANGLEFSVGADLEGRKQIRHGKFDDWPDRCGV